MDPDVDKHYKEKYFPTSGVANASKPTGADVEEFHTGYSIQEYRATDSFDGISSITKQLRALSILQIEPEDEDRPCHLASLPDELLLHILLQLSLSSLSSLLRTSLVCKKLHQLCHDENSLYKQLCMHYFKPFISPSVLL